MRILAEGLFVTSLLTMTAGVLRGPHESVRCYGPNRAQWLITAGWVALFLAIAAAGKAGR